MSASIIQFPTGGRPGRRWTRADRDAPAVVLILPIVRVDRWDGALTPEERAFLLAADKRRPRRGRRRRREPFSLTPDDLR